MSVPLAPRATSLAATLAGALALTIGAPVAAPTALGLAPAAKAQAPSPQMAQFQATLARYGTFQAHARYGEVWIPAAETVPQGWHPYPPCHWVHTPELGWYFDDKTEWGKIVHHYGRWAHDKDLGWVWVKGEEFSPGWVVWRTSDKWVGWAPMPPEQDIREISATEFNSDKHWIFVDAKKFSSTCDGGKIVTEAPAALYPTILTETKVVTEIRFVNGIVVFVLPPPLVWNIVNINIGVFPPWNPCFFGAWFWQWNWMVNNVVININLPPPNCPHPLQQQQKPIIPIKSLPPPPPPGKRADLPPSFQPPSSPPVTQPPVRQPDPPTLTPVPPVKVPPVRVPPQVTVPDRPPTIRPIDPGFNRPPTIRPIDPGFNRPPTIRPIDPGIVKPVRPGSLADLPKPPTIRPVPMPVKPTVPAFVKPDTVKPNLSHVRTSVPKLVRSPDVVKRHPGLTQAVPRAPQGRPVLR